MSTAPLPTRRTALKTAALAALGLPLITRSTFAATAASSPASAKKPAALPLGVASYTTRMLNLDETIATLRVLRIPNLALTRIHCNWEAATADECRAIAEKVRAGGLNLNGSGVINLPNDAAKLRVAFDNVKAAGLATMVCKPEPAALPLVMKFAADYNQRLAIHNHGPEDKVYPSPLDVWKAIQPFDDRIGLCLDVGHAVRAGADPVAVIRQCASRIYDIHLKDTIAGAGDLKDLPVEIGSGRIDIPGILRALQEINYAGIVSIEYEKPTGNVVTGLAESTGYVRGVQATL